MQERANRRRYLQLFGATVVAGVAGCTDSDTAGDDGSDGGSSDDGSASDGTDDGTTDDTDDGGPSDDGETDDSTDGDETDDGTDDSTDDDDGQTDENTTPRLEDVFTWTDSYVMDIDASDFTGTWRFNDGDWYLSATSDGQTSELYTVSTDGGTDTYVVAEGQCFVTESVRRDPFDPQEPVDDNQEYVATGRTTIDGQDVYEFDVDDGIYYVSVATGYPVRYEGADGTVVRFHSWDETDPITPPEMECTRR